MLVFVPGVAQISILIALTSVSLLLLVWRYPLVERNTNYVAMFGKLIELYSLSHIVAVLDISDVLSSAAEAILLVNQVGIGIMILVALYDAAVKIKDLCKKGAAKVKASKGPDVSTTTDGPTTDVPTPEKLDIGEKVGVKV